MQNKKQILKESICNTLIGFIVTLIFSPFIYNICDIQYTFKGVSLATLLFTILSILRNYLIRRIFNK